jgi:hypothetical protein
VRACLAEQACDAARRRVAVAPEHALAAAAARRVQRPFEGMRVGVRGAPAFVRVFGLLLQHAGASWCGRGGLGSRV